VGITPESKLLEIAPYFRVKEEKEDENWIKCRN
jgi:hypothetical protein